MKRAIYTYKNKSYGSYLLIPIFLELAKLSVSQAKKFYTTELYCDSDSVNFFLENKFEFDKIHILPELDEYKGDLYGVYKMFTCIAQTSSYVHLDFDSILLKPLVFKEPVTFGYYDDDYRGMEKYSLTMFVREFYVETFENKLKNFIDPDVYLRWKWQVFPNCSLFAVHDYREVARIYKDVLDMFHPVLYYFDYNAKISQFLEQFMIGEMLERRQLKHTSIQSTNPKIDEVTTETLRDLKFIHLQGFITKQEPVSNLIEKIKNEEETLRSWL